MLFRPTLVRTNALVWMLIAFCVTIQEGLLFRIKGGEGSLDAASRGS